MSSYSCIGSATVLAALLVAAPVSAGGLQLISAGPQGQPARGWNPTISSNGRYMAFASDQDLVNGGDNPNGVYQLFLYDMLTHDMELVSVNSDEAPANDHSGPWPDFPSAGGGMGASDNPAAISDDGRFVVFHSYATNLDPDDTNIGSDVFIRDRLEGITERVSINPAGTGAGWPNPIDYSVGTEQDMSRDGRYVIFQTFREPNGFHEVCVPGSVFVCHDLQRYGPLDVPLAERSTELITVADGRMANAPSEWPALSADGRFVAFSSQATNLVEGIDYTQAPGTASNPAANVFLKDMDTGEMTIISLDMNGDAAGHRQRADVDVSEDGRFVTFASNTDLIVPEDTNGLSDVFVVDTHDPNPATRTIRVSVDSFGVEGDGHASRPDISHDGRFVVYQAKFHDLAPIDAEGSLDVFVHDLETRQTARVSIDEGVRGHARSKNAKISGDGTWIIFESKAANWLQGEIEESRVWLTRNPLKMPSMEVKPLCGLGFELALLLPLMILGWYRLRRAAAAVY